METKNFSDWLLEQLRANNMSQADLARASGLTPQAISNYINDPFRKPDTSAVIAIAGALKLPPDLVFRHAGHRNMRHPSPDHARRVSSSYILSGLSYCARCGSPHYGLSARQRSGAYYRRYACTRAHNTRGAHSTRSTDGGLSGAQHCDAKAIPADVLENAVLDELRTRILQPDHLDELRQAVLAGRQRRQSQLETHRRALVKDLTAVRRKIANITSAIAEAGHSRSLLFTLQSLETEQAEIMADIARLDAARDPDPDRLESLDHDSLAEELRARLESHDPAELRQILRGLVQRVLVDRDGSDAGIEQITGQITYYYPPPSIGPKA